MKNKIFLILIAFAISGMTYPSGKNPLKAHLKKNYSKVSDSLYAGIGEVTNEEYREFLTWLEANNKVEELKICKPDTQKWQALLSFDDPMTNYYHSHPAYNKYPAVNISYDAAMKYCAWLTQKYKTHVDENGKHITFRLPTRDEWKKAARPGTPNYVFPWGGPFMRNSKGLVLANFIAFPDALLVKQKSRNTIQVDTSNTLRNYAGSLNDELNYTTPSISFWPNAIGLYCMAGNVSEMLLEKGQTIGGSWKSFGYYLRIDAEDEFDGKAEAGPQIGFRVFAIPGN